VKAEALPSKNLGRSPRADPVERGHPLLAVEQKLDDASSHGSVTTVRGRFRLRCPNKQPTNWVPMIERVEKAPDLIPIPYVPALEFRERHMPVVDVVKDRGNLHPHFPPRTLCCRSISASNRRIERLSST
jgi:hypothetical protein